MLLHPLPGVLPIGEAGYVLWFQSIDRRVQIGYFALEIFGNQINMMHGILRVMMITFYLTNICIGYIEDFGKSSLRDI